VLQTQVEALPESESPVKTWLQKATGAIQQQITQARASVQEAGQTLQRWDNTGRTAFNQLRQSDEFQTFQDNVKQSVQTAGEWLASRPDAIIHHRFARDAFNLFNQGHDRTFENAYQVGAFQISRQGQQTFVVSNDDGDTLLQFQAKKSVLPGQLSLNLQAVKGEVKDFYKAVQDFRRPEARAVGASEKEAAYSARVQQTVDAIQQALDALGTNTLSAKGYQVQATDGSLTIRSHDRKGPIYTAEQSRLTPKDFKHLQHIGQHLMSDSTQKSALDEDTISAYVDRTERADEEVSRAGYLTTDAVGLMLDAGDIKAAALNVGVSNDAFDQAVATYETTLQQERVQAVAPVLAEALYAEGTTQLKGKHSVIEWDAPSSTLTMTHASGEVTLAAEWTGENWNDRGSALSPKDVEKVLDLSPAIAEKAQQKQHASRHKLSQAEL